jgi:Uma2 family endonuclease
MPIEEDRIMSTATMTPAMTQDEFERDYGGSRGHELVNGQLVRTAMPSFGHNEIETATVALLNAHTRPNKLGRAVGGETLIKLKADPETVRAADIVYISYARLPQGTKSQGAMTVMPELVGEIRSTHDRKGEIEKKVREYLDAGISVVMTIDPELELLSLHRKGELDQRFHNGDTVTIPDVLPGFSVPVKAFFGNGD